MKAAQPLKDIPVNDLPLLKTKWRAWWSKLCPEDPSQVPADRSDRSWESWRKPSKNGFLLVMMCLAWWGSAAGADNKWKEAIEEVVRALQWLGSTTPAVKGNLPPVTAGKRKRPEEVNEDLAPSERPSRKTK